ncbi:hypothetical protein ABN034_18395 [Actinopolymorpha sp. B11F2]
MPVFNRRAARRPLSSRGSSRRGLKITGMLMLLLGGSAAIAAVVRRGRR